MPFVIDACKFPFIQIASLVRAQDLVVLFRVLENRPSAVAASENLFEAQVYEKGVKVFGIDMECGVFRIKVIDGRLKAIDVEVSNMFCVIFL